ncbi:hypothetical protein RHGRI_013139 [Rhododendron griersonianum]|uniref:Uncharacterized protein n=1 Tax=Rhododendron griersonianum TaxID=479676 RepID=A0AAV6K4R0_9ERIC|nr:hypothetical protein RHGRI_013139 [Rhododendron griersonianum]
MHEPLLDAIEMKLMPTVAVAVAAVFMAVAALFLHWRSRIWQLIAMPPDSRPISDVCQQHLEKEAIRIMLHLSDSHHSPFAQGTSILLHEPILEAIEMKLMPAIEVSEFLAIRIVFLAYDTHILHWISRIQQLIAMPPYSCQDCFLTQSDFRISDILTKATNSS